MRAIPAAAQAATNAGVPDLVRGATRMIENGLRIDIGCGSAKREGFIGIDYVASPGVDEVVDIVREPLPFPDNSVSHVYSAHVFEHIVDPHFLVSEIVRVCADGAKIEIVTPYAFTDSAFVYGHVSFMTEMPWTHFCVSHRESHIAMLRGRWLLHNINFVVMAATEQELREHNFSVDFAIKYLKGVVLEFQVEMEYQSDLSVPAIVPTRTYSHSRYEPRIPLSSSAPV
jgi:predicted SAM-dependent methyltransferase